MTETEQKRADTLRRLLAPYAGRPLLPEEAMRAALALAEQAAAEGEIPVGCVLLRDGMLLTGDYNGRETFRDALYHAEAAAIRRASALLGGWRLSRCTLYVTMEPCPMCAGAIWAARVPEVVIGAKDARAGALGSLLNLNSYPLNHKPAVSFGLLENECRAVLQRFFAARREQRKHTKEQKTNE